MVRFLDTVAIPLGLCVSHDGNVGSHFLPGRLPLWGEAGRRVAGGPIWEPEALGGERLWRRSCSLPPEGTNGINARPDSEKQKQAKPMVNVAMCCRESQLF